MDDIEEIAEHCARIAEDVAQECGDGDGELYIARKIADRIRNDGALSMIREARKILSEAGIVTGQPFEGLSIAQLEAIKAEAATAYLRKHGKPLPADSASFIRKRYDLLQIRAR